MIFFVFTQKKLSRNGKIEKLDAARKSLEEETLAVWNNRTTRPKDMFDTYDVPLSGFAFTDYLDELIRPTQLRGILVCA
jgi:hypothetical protein